MSTPSLRGRLAQSRITVLGQEEAADVALTLFAKWLHEQAEVLDERVASAAEKPDVQVRLMWQRTAITDCARAVELLIIENKGYAVQLDGDGTITWAPGPPGPQGRIPRTNG